MTSRPSHLPALDPGRIPCRIYVLAYWNRAVRGGVSVLPDLSVIFVIFAVILLAVVLDRVLFKPLLRVMRERDRP